MRKIFLSGVFLCVLAAFSHAQFSISAYTDKTTAEVGDEIILTVEVRGARGDISSPELPSLPNFNSYFIGHMMSMDNFNSVAVFTYSLLPRFAGKAEIGPITYNYMGKNYITEPFTITVYRKGETPAASSPAKRPSAKTAAAQPAAPAYGVSVLTGVTNSLPKQQSYPSIFLKAVADKKSAYVGEQITLTMNFYTTVDNTGLPAPTYIPPDFTGLVLEDLGGQVGGEKLNGKQYAYTKINTALFGVTAGKAEIGRAAVSYYVNKTRGSIALDKLLGYLVDSGTIYSDPLAIDIKPLPAEGKGSHFYGAVGRNFTIDLKADVQNPEAGEAVTLTLTVTGQGNLKTITTPKINLPLGFRAYETAATSNILPVKGKIQGSKTFKTVVIPSESGAHSIPPVSFTFFDTADKKYKTLQTKELVFNVKPSSKAEGAAVSFGGTQAAGVRVLNQDINYIKENVFSAGGFILPLKLINIFSVILIISALLYGGAARLIKNNKPQYKIASGAVKKASSEEALSSALKRYITLKTGLSVGSTHLKELLARLKGTCGLSESSAAELEALWQKLDSLKYAPAQNGGAELENLKLRASALLEKMEKELR